MRKQRKKLKTPKTSLKNDQKRLTLRKTVKNTSKRYHSVDIRTGNKKNQKKIGRNIEKAMKSA